VAATTTAPAQLAGEKFAAFALLLPAATTTLAPRPIAPVIAVPSTLLDGQVPDPPRLRLSTFAGCALAGTPDTVPPDAQVMASAMSAFEPPQ
jgi:hypothetical protein